MGNDHGISSNVHGQSKAWQLNGLIILRQGWLEKKSRFTRSWKKQWCVVNGEHLFTFKTQNMSENPTESIPLSTASAVTSTSQDVGNDTMFSIQTKDTYHFRADNVFEMKGWIDIINKYRFNCIRIPVTINCNRDTDFDDNSKLVIPYNNKYEYDVKHLIKDIMSYVQHKYHPLKFITKKAQHHPKVGKPVNYNSDHDDYKNIEINITDYNKIGLRAFGLVLEIDIDAKNLGIQELMIYFKIIKKKYQRSELDKKRYTEILSAVIQQIKQNIQFMKKPLDLNMLHFGFINGFIAKHEFNIIAPQLLSDELSRLLQKIGADDLSKYVFEDENEQILSHYDHKNLVELLKRHYSDKFAIFVFEKFKPEFVRSPISKRIEYLNIVSVNILIWIYRYKNICKQLDIKELEFLFNTIKKYVKYHDDIDTNRHLQILSNITIQIAEKHAAFLSLDADNFHFIFYNKLVETRIITAGLTVDDFSKSIKNINDANINKHIFEKKPKQCLLHYNQNELIELLKVYYSESFALFVFYQFYPSFLESAFLQRIMYLNNISIDRMIWVYNNNDIGENLDVNELMFYFKTFQTYILTHTHDNKQNEIVDDVKQCNDYMVEGHIVDTGKKDFVDLDEKAKHWKILLCVMQQLIKQKPQFIAQKTNLHFIFIHHLVTIENVKEIQIIIQQLSVDELCTLLSVINDKNIEELIFEKEQKPMLSHYNVNDLMILLNKYYSDYFARFVFNQFSPSFITSKLLQRKQYLKIVSINMLIWLYNKNNIGQHLHIDESIYYFKIMKKYTISQKSNQNNKCLEVLSSVTDQIINKNVTFITSDANNLDFVFLNGLEKKYQIEIIVSQLTADGLSRLVKTINDENLTKYIFEDENKKILYHYNNQDLLSLLKKHYSHSFAIFVFERFNSFSIKQRKTYLEIVSIDIMIWILDENYGQFLQALEISIFVNKIKDCILSDNAQQIKCSYFCTKVIKQKGWINEIVTDDLQLFIIYDLVSISEVKIIMNEVAKRQKIYEKQCKDLLDEVATLQYEKQKVEQENRNLKSEIYNASQEIQTLKNNYIYEINQKNQTINNLRNQR